MQYEPPPKPPIKLSRPRKVRRIPKPSSIGPYKWYSGTERFSDGSQDTWKYYAPTLHPSSGTRKKYP